MNVGSGELLIIALDDSDEITHQVLTRHLSDSGLSVVVVTAENQCLPRIRELHPDLILYFLSNAHPRFPSSEHIAQLKEAAPDIAVIALASMDSIKLVEPALVRGADDYLMTPVMDYALLDHLVMKNIRLGRERNRRLIEGEKLAMLNRKLEESLRILEKDQRAGFQVQRGMMPQSPFQVGDVIFTHKIIPSVILSGDFIDYFQFSETRFLFYIADVSGHGASSAFVTVLLKNLSQRLIREYEQLELADTAGILGWFNSELLSSNLEHHVTMFLGIVDTRNQELQYSNAAHFPGTIFSSPDQTEFLEIGGLPLGLYESASYETQRLELPPEFSLVMFSDGVFEVMKQQTLKAKEDYLLALVENGSSTVSALTEHLGLSSVKDAPDDIALFTIARAA